MREMCATVDQCCFNVGPASQLGINVSKPHALVIVHVVMQWIDVFALLPQKYSMSVTKSYLNPKIPRFVRGQSVAETCFSHWG